MKKFLLLCGVVAAISAAGQQLLFDFESSPPPIRLLWNKEHAKAEPSTEWATMGARSLRIEAPAYDSATMNVNYYPGVDLRLPVRDWSKYRFLQFDLKVEQDETPFSILIQYGKRHERISAAYHFGKGAYRVKLNLPELIGEPAVERLSNIRSFEFHVTRPAADFVIFIDNIQLLEGIPGELPHYDSILSLADPDHPKPLISHKTISADAGLDRMLEIIGTEFPGKGFGVKAASVSEPIPFRNLEFPGHWGNQIDLAMGQNETRSVQAVFFRKPADRAETFEVSCSIPGLEVKIERVGYLNLPPFYRLEERGFVPGWYPDPVLAVNGSDPLEPEQWAQPLILSVGTAAGTKPGVYRGSLTVKYLEQSVSTPVVVTVMPVAMPKYAALPILLGVGGNIGKPDREFWLSYRMNPHYTDSGNIYDRRRKTPLDISLLSELVNQGMTVFNMIYVNQTDFSKYDENTLLNGIFRKYSDAYMEKLAAAGLAERAIIYSYDEVTVSGENHKSEYDTVRKILGALKERYGKYGVRTAATLRDCNDPAIHSLPVDIWIPIGTALKPEAAERLRSMGKEVWWYHIWWESWYPLAWSRSIPWTTLHRNYQGWLYYNVNGPWSKQQALGDSALTSWSGFSVPNLMMYGTGSLVYQDQQGLMRPSLRLINFREGMYDYDLAVGLKARIAFLKEQADRLTPAEKTVLAEAEALFAGDAWQEIGELTDEPVGKNDSSLACALEQKRLAMLKARVEADTIRLRLEPVRR